MRPTTRLKQLFNGPRLFVLPGVCNALQAKMVEALGYEAVYVSGGLTSAQYGFPDVGLTTMTEVVANAGYVAAATKLPVLSDADTGYGNAINVRRTVQAFIRAGVAGVHIEDQLAPKRCGFVTGKQLIPLEEAVGKYRAALDARDELDPDFVIVARTDARTAAGGGLEEALRRAKAYKAAGADVVYFEGPQSLAELRMARDAVAGPLMCTGSAMEPHPSLEELEALGVSVGFFPGLASEPGNLASWDFLADFKVRGMDAMREFRARTKGHPLSRFKLNDLLGTPQIRAMEEKYLPAEEMAKYDGSQGIYTP